MKRCLMIIWLLPSLISVSLAEGNYPSLNLLNSKNLTAYFDDYLGDLYNTRGGLHFTSSDTYLLVSTISRGISWQGKGYEEVKLTFDEKAVPFLFNITNGPKDIKIHAELFKNSTTEVVVYPALDRLFINVNGRPYAKLRTKAGFKEKLLRPDENFLSVPTYPGEYTVLGPTAHYISKAYYETTVVPFGAWLVKKNGKWVYNSGGDWLVLPQHIVKDLEQPVDKQKYSYYDYNDKVPAARWGSNDFGKYILWLSKAGRNMMAYTDGRLLFEQIILVKDLTQILTQPGSDDFDSCISNNANFTYYKTLQALEPQIGAVVPRRGLARQKALGKLQTQGENNSIIAKRVYWYQKLKDDWSFWQDLRNKLREDFIKMGVLSLANQQNLVENWLTSRIFFEPATPPAQAKYVRELSFENLFLTEDDPVFSGRESKVMRQLIKQALSEEAGALEFHSVRALNEYNFGLLLDEILGDLYKSHGCLHVTPRDSFFLYSLLPVNTRIVVYDYSKNIEEYMLEQIPYLTTMVNVKEDLDGLKEKFKRDEDVKIAVYPLSGIWLIYIKDQPFAKLRVKGGPKQKYYQMLGRDEKERPVFEEHLAYPTTPGIFYVYKSMENYISNLYYQTTVIPMGGVIKKEGERWLFTDIKGNPGAVPNEVLADIYRPEAERGYKYYDPVTNASGEVVEMKWGSHPFGRYALQTLKANKTLSPELIHSSGGLIMEERNLIDDLIQILSAPFDKLDECVEANANFSLYKACSEFIGDPAKEEIIGTAEAAGYKLYKGSPLTTLEAATLAVDSIVASKIIKKQKLSPEDFKLLLDKGLAAYSNGNLKINYEKIRGMDFETYQYVVTIEKYASHYKTLEKHWDDLSGLRQALLQDFNNLVIKDHELLHKFVRELMLKRTELKLLTRQEALEMLDQLLN